MSCFRHLMIVLSMKHASLCNFILVIFNNFIILVLSFAKILFFKFWISQLKESIIVVTHLFLLGLCSGINKLLYFAGACWAFSATGAIEGINKIFSGSLVSLSEQELVDCDKSYNNGCEGGLMDYAFQFVIKNNGIDTEEDYPFQGHERSCNKEKVIACSRSTNFQLYVYFP